VSEYSQATAHELLGNVRITLEAYSSLRGLFLRGKRLFKATDKAVVLQVCIALESELEPYVCDTLEPGLTPKQHSVFMKAYSDVTALRRSLEIRTSLTRESLADKLQFDRDLYAAAYTNLVTILNEQQEEDAREISLDLEHEGTSGLGGE